MSFLRVPRFVSVVVGGLRLGSLVLAGCHDPAAGTDSGAPPSSSTKPAVAEQLDAILTAEHRRSAAEITTADQQSRDVRVRRAAARALSRIGGDAARAGLYRALADEDDEVATWAAYGVGFACKGHEKESVAALVAAALSRIERAETQGQPASSGAPSPSASSPALGGDTAQPDGSSPRPGTLAASGSDALGATARGIGRCAADESEPTLVAWLAFPRARAVEAAYGLGDVAIAKKKLREETLVALLNLGAGSAAAPPVPEALFPIGRLENVPLSVVDRIREVATARLAEPGDARLYAVRALARAGADAAPELGRVLAGVGAFAAAERAEAARGLKRLGKAGQRFLFEALPALAPHGDAVSLSGLVGEDVGVLLTILDTLDGTPIPPASQKTVRDLAALALPPQAPASVARRVSWIRCSAAKLVAGANIREPLLLGCDVMPAASPSADVPDAGAPDAGSPDAAVARGSIGARAVVSVLGRADITGPRLAAYKAYARGSDLRAREAALDLLEAHAEVDGDSQLLAEALACTDGGVLATAAEVIAKQPQRASDEIAIKRKKGKKRKGDKKGDDPADAVVTAPSPAVIKALLAALGSPAVAKDPEVLASVMDAAGALALKEATPRLEELCKSPWPALREHAAKALGGVTGKKEVACDPPVAGGDAPGELRGLVRTPTTLTFDTDVGALTITLDPSVAPVTATRIVELAKSGYYAGLVVHRVVPGFVTQFGAPQGDGYGGPPEKPPLRCETSPLPFAPMRVGMALSGRDTGSSQLFVMHGRYPHLDGGYAWVGTATGPWAAFVDGDVIRKVDVTP